MKNYNGRPNASCHNDHIGLKWGRDGVMWELWIDENGDLQVDAPLSEEDKVEEFIGWYRPLLKDEELIEFIDEIEPIGSEYRSIKLLAVLTIMRKIPEGQDLGFSASEVQEVVQEIENLPLLN
jgi:hypothetical protein